MYSRSKGNADVQDLLLHELPDRPADKDVGIFSGISFLCLGRFQVGEDRCILGGRVIDPDAEHPVHDLIVSGQLNLCQPPDAPLGDGADPDLPVAGEGPVLDRLPEARGCRLQNLLQVLREGHVIEEEDRPRLDRMVVEGLV